MEAHNLSPTLKDWNENLAIVFSLPVFSRYDNIELDNGQAATLIDLHMKKIKYSDLVWVVCPGDYIGRHTQDEIDYAITIGLMVKYDNRGL